jgi:hypothetical protein
MNGMVLAGFLATHGMLHLAIWLWRMDAKAPHPPPFRPDHSALLTATRTPEAVVRQLSLALAAGAAATYLLAAISVALDLAWAVPAAVAAALLGVVLKVLYFHPWLSVGVLLDVGVLMAALLEWPVNLS